MATFVFVHGGGDVGWYWHLVERELHGLGHQTVAPDLPCDDDTASLVDYADAVVDAIDDRRESDRRRSVVRWLHRTAGGRSGSR